jgi:zinc/manganese transport system permease protein
VFTDYMTPTWIVATVVAVIAGVVGFFVVLRGTTFAAHALPNGAFTGAAAASLLGVNVLPGLAVFAVLSALGIGWLSKRGRHDVVIALATVLMLSLGAVFLSMGTEYEPEIFSLLFGEVFGIATSEIAPTVALAVVCVLAILVLYRPLTLSAVAPRIAEARGISQHRLNMVFLVVIALATSLTVPVVGTLLIFSLMIGPAAAARCFTSNPTRALSLSAILAVLTVWASIACSYQSNWPIGFFVGVFGALIYAAGRLWTPLRHRHERRPNPHEHALQT